jgi:hypothetical protein
LTALHSQGCRNSAGLVDDKMQSFTCLDFEHIQNRESSGSDVFTGPRIRRMPEIV